MTYDDWKTQSPYEGEHEDVDDREDDVVAEWADRIVADSRDRKSWLSARMDYVCSSECSAMLGESRGTLDRAHLVMLKAGLAEPWAGNETTRIGRHMEPFFVEAAKDLLGWKLEPFGYLVRDPVCHYLAATPDFLSHTPWGLALVQTKVTTARAQEDCRPRKDGSPSDATYASGPPIYFVIQQQAELACMALEWSALLVLHAAAGGLKLRAYATRAHHGVIARIRAEAPKVMADANALKAGRLSA